MTINPPTGDEQPQKYYGGAYLDEELAFKREIASAAADGRPVNTEGVHPVTIAAVAPGLLNDLESQPLGEGDPTDKDLPGLDKDKSLDSVGVSDGTSMHGEDTRLVGAGTLTDSPTSATTLAQEDIHASQVEDGVHADGTPLETTAGPDTELDNFDSDTNNNNDEGPSDFIQDVLNTDNK